MDWWTRTKLWRAAYYIAVDRGVSAVALDRELTRATNPRSIDFREWALDVRRCAGDYKLLLDNHYDCMMNKPSNEYKKIECPETRSVIRKFWRKIEQKKGLVTDGRWIIRRFYE